MEKSSPCTYLSAASPPRPATPRVSSACSVAARGVSTPTTLGVAGLELLLSLSRAVRSLGSRARVSGSRFQ
eukprot:586455-Pyramimonas_sp.AAC.1